MSRSLKLVEGRALRLRNSRGFRPGLNLPPLDATEYVYTFVDRSVVRRARYLGIATIMDKWPSSVLTLFRDPKTEAVYAQLQPR